MPLCTWPVRFKTEIRRITITWIAIAWITIAWITIAITFESNATTSINASNGYVRNEQLNTSTVTYDDVEHAEHANDASTIRVE